VLCVRTKKKEEECAPMKTTPHNRHRKGHPGTWYHISFTTIKKVIPTLNIACG
jgi:hypothetical protein